MSILKLVRYPVLLTIMASPLTGQTPAPVPLSLADSTSLMQQGRSYTRWMLQGKADSLVAVMTPEFLESMGGAAGVSDRLAMIAEHGGTETKVLAEKMTRRDGRPQFWHEGEFSAFVDEPLVFRIVFDEKGKVVGIGMGPKSQAQSDQ